MNRITHSQLFIIAISPLAVFVGFALVEIVAQNPHGIWPGLVALYISLLLLVAVPGGVFRAARLPLGLALATSVLLIPGFSLFFGGTPPSAPALGVPVNITMQPSTTTPGAVDISGLNYQYPATLSRIAQGASYAYQLQVEMDVSMNPVQSPPAHFDDGNGDTLDFQSPAPAKIHLQDNRGGYADLHWDGAQFVLDGTYSAGLSQWPAGAMHPHQSNDARIEWGVTFFLTAPLLASIFVGWFIVQWRSRMGEPFGPAVASIILMVIGIAVLFGMGVSIFGPPTAGDVPYGLPFLALFLLFGGSGLGLWCWQVISVANAIKRMSIDGELTPPTA